MPGDPGPANGRVSRARSLQTCGFRQFVFEGNRPCHGPCAGHSPDNAPCVR